MFYRILSLTYISLFLRLCIYKWNKFCFLSKAKLIAKIICRKGNECPWALEASQMGAFALISAQTVNQHKNRWTSSADGLCSGLLGSQLHIGEKVVREWMRQKRRSKGSGRVLIKNGVKLCAIIAHSYAFALQIFIQFLNTRDRVW